MKIHTAENGLELHPDKFKILVIKKDDIQEQEINLKGPNGEKLKVLKHVRILGIEVSDDFTSTRFLDI